MASKNRIETRVATGYRPRRLQDRLHRSLKRFNVLVAHRRFGKTVFAINELIDRALVCERKRPRYAYIAPLAVQAKGIAWDYLKAYSAPIPGAIARETELRVDLPNGARIQLHGADNPDRLRGLYFDGVVLDEFGDMPPRLWSEIVRPALADREGWAVFIGTPKGRNGFYDLYERARQMPDWFAALFKASETRIIPPAELEAARAVMSSEQYDQEFECAFAAALLGAYYAREIGEAEVSGRIGRVPYDPLAPVETWWDLGVGDSTAIWFVQRVGPEIRLIDYYEMTGEGLPHYAKVLQEKSYVYSQHVAPHDIVVRELGTGKSRLEVARELGLTFIVAPRLGIDDGINAVRALLPRAWIDAERCGPGVEALRQYRKDFDERLKIFRDHPRHDWTSHAADALRTGAIAPQPARWGGQLTYQPTGIV
jgi:phage terminase large subunit